MHRKIFTILFFLLSFFSSSFLHSQNNIYRSEYFFNQSENQKVNQSKNTIQTSFKPFFASIADSLYRKNVDSIVPVKDSLSTKKFKSGWIYRKLRKESFVDFKKGNFRLSVNPLFDLEIKRDDDKTQNLYNNTRGLELFGNIDQKIYFYSSYLENQARFEPYVSEYISKQLVVPGRGAPKFKKNNELDFSMASGWLFFNLTKNLSVQLGQSKHFIGEGYRSLLLSDNAFNYPFVRVQAKLGCFNYTLLWAEHQLFETVYYNYHFRKYNAISYLSWVSKKGFELALFESVEWPGNTSERRNFNINFFNPVMFWRTFQFGLDSDKNVLLGINSKLRLYDFSQAYAHFALDNLDKSDKSNNNFAFQLGVKHFDFFHNKYKNQKLFAQIEFNYISPYTYTNSNPNQSYTHYNQPLAHPSGSGLIESIGIIEYSYKDFRLRIIGSYLKNSVDTTNTNFGSDVFLPNEITAGIVSHIGNRPGQGIENKIIKIKSELIFVVNSSSNLQIFGQLVYRKQDNILQNRNDLILSIGLRSDINNFYFDF